MHDLDANVENYKRQLEAENENFKQNMPAFIANIEKQIESLEAWSTGPHGLFVTVPPLKSGGFAAMPSRDIQQRCEDAVRCTLEAEVMRLKLVIRRAKRAFPDVDCGVKGGA